MSCGETQPGNSPLRGQTVPEGEASTVGSGPPAGSLKEYKRLM